MKLKRFFLIGLSVFFGSCSKNGNTVHSKQGEEKKIPFQKISQSHSKIDFRNTLVPNLEKKQSVYNYDYFYSGSGVGIADLNDDGLLDLFFAGNQENNRFYLNKGNMQFEDVSKRAGININKGWVNGVTFADINNDGLLDIYLCQAGPVGLDRTNKLFINRGNMRFVEQAAQYGLNDRGISTQAAFFDYDKDGDLDCFVMNENPLYGVQPDQFYKYLKEIPNLAYASSSHLYENRNGKYHDITKAKGLLKTTFGLGLAVSDINNDGWQDIYIANDYYIPDALYINQKGKGFVDEIKKRTNQVSYYSMGMDVADVNNDGHQDIFTLDMAAKDHYRSKTLMASMNVKAFDYFVNTLGFQHQYMFNALQMNNGDHTFKNIGQTGLAKTDWSWSVLMQDYDNDTDTDIFITNGIRKNGFDNDYRMRIKSLVKRYRADIPMDSLKAAYASMPSSRLKNVFFENLGNKGFTEIGDSLGLAEPSFSNGAAYGDLDNDGDLDLVVNNIDEPVLLYKNMIRENKAGNFIRIQPEGLLSESFPRVILKYDGKIQLQEIRRVRGYYSSSENMGHFGLGQYKKIDTVRIEWPSGKFEEKYKVKVNQTLVFDERNAKSPKMSRSEKRSMNTHFKPIQNILDFVHHESDYDDFQTETLLPYKQSTLGPFLSKGDLNGDGIDDLFIGGAKGESASIFIQNEKGFVSSPQQIFKVDKDSEDMGSFIFDFDGDGDNDLYVVSGGNEYPAKHSAYVDRLYLNDGAGNFKKLNDPLLAKNRISGKTVAAIDYDHDGDFDLIVGNRMIPGKYPIPEPSFIYENRDGKLIDVTMEIAPQLSGFGAINKLLVTDFDNDGQKDFIAVGEWTGIGLFKNNNGYFEDVSKAFGVEDLKGWWYTITETDINNDGNKEYIIGNLGDNSKYKTSSKKPLRIYAADFDNNGTHDMMLSYEYKGEYVPLRGLECSSGQVPMLTKKFKSYESFANANITELFGERKISTSYQRYVNEFKSIVLFNTGQDSFKVKTLSKEAQLFPVLSSISHDVDKDGFLDVILSGGIYNTEVETPRLDAGIGIVLISDKKEGYKPMDWQKSGLYLSGNVKSMTMLKNHKGNYLLLAALNNDQLKVFESN